MARTVRDTNLETRAARLRLKSRAAPYWRLIDQGAHLGYYKGRRAGSWIARFFLGSGRYATSRLGAADDIQDADSASILSFAQAQGKARGWFASQARLLAGEGHHGPYTVTNAWTEYVKWYAVHRKDLQTATYAANAHILPKLGPIQVAKLTPAKIRAWHEAIATERPRLRTRKGRPQNYGKAPGISDAKRQRKATANRVLTFLKAALNYAWRDGKVSSDDAWRRVKPFRDVSAPRVRYLTHDACRRLANACEPTFRRMVQAALYTGCRYGELCALRAADFDPENGTVAIRTSKSGKPRYVVLADEGQTFFANVTLGRSAGEYILRNAAGETWAHSNQFRPLRQACETAGINPPVSFHILRHTYATHLVTAGAPLQVVAHNLGHADIRMTERHYAHLAPSFVADTIRRLAPKLGLLKPANIVAIQPAKATGRP